MNAMLSLQLIGTPQVRLGATPLRFQRRRSLALLAYLVLTAREHSREALASLLGGDAAPEAARHALRIALAELRALLPDDLCVTRQTIAFAPTHPVQLDLASVQATLASGDVAAMQTALDHAPGELLEGLCLSQAPEFESWLALERERWHEQRVQALQTLLDHYAGSGALAAGIAVARQLLADTPWCEEAHGQLMRLLARAGQRAAALVQYARCRAVLARELGVAPLPATTALYQRLRAGLEVLPSNLGGALAPLVGRAAEQERLIAQLGEPACRLITLVGLGGMGKSHLAHAVAAHFLRPEYLAESSLFPDGLFVVDLANLAPARKGGQEGPLPRQQMARAIAGALGLAPGRSGDPVLELSSYLRSKTLLLILDNIEHLVEESDLLSSLLQAAPGLKLLVTSRVRLQTADEAVLELEGLDVPADAAELERAASQLFLQSARRSAPKRVIGDSDARHIIRICELVQGHPLALIVAAGWLHTLSCQAIAAELEVSFDLLQDVAGELPNRQSTLRRILEWSVRQLEGGAQQALRRMAVFCGGFEREAVQRVAGVTLLQLRALCDASLLYIDDTGRYRLHELVRRFAAEQLSRTPAEVAQLEACHAAYYAGLVQRQISQLRQTCRANQLMLADSANIRRAWQWSIAHRAITNLEPIREGIAIWLELNGMSEQGSNLCGEGMLPNLKGILDQIVLQGERHRLGAVDCAELDQNIMHMVPDRVATNIQLGRNLVIAIALDQHCQHLHLAL